VGRGKGQVGSKGFVESKTLLSQRLNARGMRVKVRGSKGFVESKTLLSQRLNARGGEG
jgi:hypothetical protein